MPAEAFAYSRVKDLVDVEGIRDNMLVGYGLVVGLNGSGDTLRNSPFTQQSLETMLERMGVNTRGENMQTKNTAAVMVTANLPAFASQGTRIDVSVSALGDAKSLEGGTLLVTPLFGADGNIYVLAQGALTIGGFSAQGTAASVTRGVPTAGRIANGAIVERQTNFKLASEHSLKLSLRNPDLTTAARIAQAINRFIGSNVADATDPSNVKLTVPADYPGGVVSMLSDIEQLKITPDQSAKVVIDEQSGVIVMGSDVRISTVAIAQGNLTIRVTETPQVSQPSPFSQDRHHQGGAAHPDPGRRQQRQQDGRAQPGRLAAEAGRRPQRAWRRPARHHLDPAGDQGRRRASGRNPGDRMSDRHDPGRDVAGAIGGHRRPRTRSPYQAAAKKAAKEFEGVFISPVPGRDVRGHLHRRPLRRRRGRTDVPLAHARPIRQGDRRSRRLRAFRRHHAPAPRSSGDATMSAKIQSC